jgi:hypothetical protein
MRCTPTAPYASRVRLPTHVWKPTPCFFSDVPSDPLRQVKSLTHIPPALQAGLKPKERYSKSVTAPKDALLTSFAYLANAPRLA